jgi:hypothetical protein
MLHPSSQWLWAVCPENSEAPEHFLARAKFSEDEV